MTLQIGRIVFDGDIWTSSLGQSDQSLSLSGEQQVATLGATAQDFRRQLRAMSGQTVPLSWPESPVEEGWWTTQGTSADISRPTVVEWSVDLTRVGAESELEFESHLIGADLDTTHDVIPKRFHAPPVGAYGYRVAGTLPFTVIRAGVDGNVVTYLNVGQVHPVWSVPPGGWYDGGCTVQVAGRTVAGREAPNSPGSWQIDNTLVRVTPNGAGIDVTSWGGAAWENKTWQLHVDGVQVGAWTSLSVLHNTSERVTVRLAQAGMTWDLTLRRGSRFVSCVVKRDISATVKIVRATAEAGSLLAGRVQASADDADGNRYVLMSAKNFTADTTNGGIELASTVFPFAVGSAVGGAAAQNGDRPNELVQQYFGYLSETVRPRPR